MWKLQKKCGIIDIIQINLERGIIMEDFLEKVKDQASKAKTGAAKLGKQVYEKTNTAIAVTKLSFAIGETESKIKEAYEAIGKIVYENYMENGEAYDFIKESCEAITELFKEKEALDAKKAELKEAVKCPECGKFNKSEAVYCSSCGARLDNEDEQYEEVGESEENDFTEEEVEAAEPVVDDDTDEIFVKVTGKVKGAAEKIKSSEVVEEVTEKVKGAAEKIKDSEVAEKVKEKVGKIKDSDVVEDVTDKVKETVNKIKENEVVEDVKDKVKEKVEKIKDSDTAEKTGSRVKKVVTIKTRKQKED